MIADSVLLGRPRARAVARPVAVSTGSRFARGLLAFVLGGAVLFESQTADHLLDLGTYLHKGIGSWTGLPFILTPLEFLLILGVAVVLISDAVKPRAETIAARALSLSLRGGWPMLLFTIALVLGIIRGALGGGDMYIGLWEVRYLLYVPACYLIARGALRTPEHVGGLLRIGLAAAILFAIEGAYRRIALIDTGLLGVTPEFSYEHEDVLFLAVFVLLVLAAYVFGAFRRVRVAGLFVAPLMLFTLFATERRAGIIVLFVGILVIAMTTLFVRRKAFIIAAFPILIISVLYLAAFWNAAGIAGQPARAWTAAGTAGQPARAIKPLDEPDPRAAASNLYRVLETINIDATIHSDP